MSLQEFDSLFKLSFLALKIVGINVKRSHPRSYSEVIKQNALFYFFNFWIYTDVVGECYWFIEGIQLQKNFAELTFVAPCVVIGFVATAKTACILHNRATTLQLLNTLKNMFPGPETRRDEDEKEVIKTSLKMSKKVVDILFWMNVATAVTFNLSPLILMAYKYKTTGRLELQLPFIIKYPFNPYRMDVWPLVFLHQSLGCTLVVFGLFGGDTLYCVCCTQIHMQFHLLKLEFEKMVTCRDTLTSFQELDKRVLVLIKKHQDLIGLVEKLEKIFTQSNLCNYLCSSFLICLCGFNATTNTDKSVIFPFVVFLISNVGQIFLLCYFGDMIKISSTSVADGIYNSKWYIAPVKIRKTILFVILRCQKPCRLTAVQYVPVDLSTFSKIISTAWSYFALLNTIYTPNE